MIVCIFSINTNIFGQQQVEICGNGIDDNGDGIADENCFDICNKQDNIWHFGLGAGLDFNSGTAVALSGGNTYVNEGCATLSNSNGQLLFYTDGEFVYDKTHFPILPAIFGHSGSSTQSSIIVPNPSPTNPNQYFVLTAEEVHGIGGIEIAATVDFPSSFSSGLGVLNILNTSLVHPDISTEKLVLTRHTNCNNYWVITHTHKAILPLQPNIVGDEYYAFLVDANGFNTNVANTSHTGTIHQFSTSNPDGIDRIGQMAISKQNDRIANVLSFSSVIDVSDFNASTGAISNTITLTMPPSNFEDGIRIAPYGVNFSPNGNYLYATFTDGRLFRFDLTAATPTRVDVTPPTSIVPTGSGNFGQIRPTPVGNQLAVANMQRGVFFIQNPDAAILTYSYIPMPSTGLGLPSTVPDYCEPDITINKIASDANPATGDAIKYYITICNNSTAAQLVDVTDALPLGLTLSTIPSGFTFTGGILSLEGLNLIPSSCTTLTIDVVVTDNGSAATCNTNQAIVNTATVTLGDCLSFSSTVTIFPDGAFFSVGSPGQSTLLSDAIANTPLLTANAAASTPQNVIIEGELIIDIPYEFFSNSEIIMGEGAQIIVTSGNLFVVKETHIHGCTHMWKGIELKPEGQFGAISSLIEDAEYAVFTNDKSTAVLLGTKFNNNYIGVYAPPSFNTTKSILAYIQACTFQGSEELTGQSFLQKYTTPNAQTTTPLLYPYAGIEMNDVVSLNLISPKLINTFQEMGSGIITNDVNLNIEGAIFKNMKPNYANGNRGIFAQSSTGGHKIKQKGFGNTPDSTISFQNCFFGILALRMDFDIRYNNMSDVYVGIASAIAHYKTGRVTLNTIDCHLVGIWMYQNDPMKLLDISDNQITMPNGDIGGIVLDESQKTPSAGIVSIRRNTIELQDARRGISLQGQAYATVADNLITLANIGPSSIYSYANRTGIFTGDGMNQLITCNNIQGAEPENAFDLSLNLSNQIFNNNADNYGIRVDATPKTTYSCNYINFVPSALHFSGDCDGSSLNLTKIGQVSRGLEIFDDNAVIGQQFHKGNQWTWDPVNTLTPTEIFDMDIVGAKNGNTVPFSSLFRADYGISVYEPFSIVGPSGWFNNIPGFVKVTCAKGTSCLGSLPALALSPILSPFDQSVTTGTFQSPNFPQTATFESNRVTYRKLKKNPSLVVTGSPEASFVQDMDTKCVGDFYQINEQVKNLCTIPAVTQNQLDNQTTLINQELAQLYRLDSLWVIDSTNRDSIEQLSLTKSLSLETLISQHQQSLKNVGQSKSQQANSTKAFNNSTQVHKKSECNLKTVNEIYLETIAKGEFGFNPGQVQKLDKIAKQCPAKGGTAVYKARAMVTFFTQVDYEALQKCKSGKKGKNARRYDNSSEKFFVVKAYPNPAINQVTIEWLEAEENSSSSSILIYNTLGQIIHQQKSNSNKVILNTEAWSGGLYIYKLYQDNQEVFTDKFTVVK